MDGGGTEAEEVVHVLFVKFQWKAPFRFPSKVPSHTCTHTQAHTQIHTQRSMHTHTYTHRGTSLNYVHFKFVGFEWFPHNLKYLDITQHICWPLFSSCHVLS